VQLRVSGDETWAPPDVIDEAYQIIREALRNAFSHGNPKLVLISIAIAPHELSAWVEDDGDGFEEVKGTGPVPAGPVRVGPGRVGTGLAAMRERAAAIGGRLTLVSVPGQGTYVELVVSLPGQPR
jgi:signal transduction histidine kinase